MLLVFREQNIIIFFFFLKSNKYDKYLKRDNFENINTNIKTIKRNILMPVADDGILRCPVLYSNELFNVLIGLYYTDVPLLFAVCYREHRKNGRVFASIVRRRKSPSRKWNRRRRHRDALIGRSTNIFPRLPTRRLRCW